MYVGSAYTRLNVISTYITCMIKNTTHTCKVTYKNVAALHIRIFVARVEVIGVVIFIFETL